MVEFVCTLIMNVAFCLGIYCLTNYETSIVCDGGEYVHKPITKMPLWFIPFYLKKLPQGKYIANALCECLVCMGFWWALPVVFALPLNVFEMVVYVICSIGINYGLSEVIN